MYYTEKGLYKHLTYFYQQSNSTRTLDINSVSILYKHTATYRQLTHIALYV